MKTSDLYKEYFDALQKRWEPVIREYFKNKHDLINLNEIRKS